MRNFSSICLTTLLLSIGIFGQSKSNSLCPTLRVNGPDGFGQLSSGIVMFTATLDGPESYKPKTRWTVSRGEIVSGQGTMSVNIKVNTTISGSVTATITFEGLPG